MVHRVHAGMGVGVYLPNVGALEVLAISRRDFPVALRLVVASLSYHNGRAAHSFFAFYRCCMSATLTPFFP